MWNCLLEIHAWRGSNMKLLFIIEMGINMPMRFIYDSESPTTYEKHMLSDNNDRFPDVW